MATFGQLFENLEYVLFQHLVTLMLQLKAHSGGHCHTLVTASFDSFLIKRSLPSIAIVLKGKYKSKKEAWSDSKVHDVTLNRSSLCLQATSCPAFASSAFSTRPAPCSSSCRWRSTWASASYSSFSGSSRSSASGVSWRGTEPKRTSSKSWSEK